MTSFPTILKIDLDALVKNFLYLRSLCKNQAICSMVKANAYGHGAIQIAQKLIDVGSDFLGVAWFGEGIKLRKSGIQIPILVMWGLNKNNVHHFLEYDLTPTISDIDTLVFYANFMKEKKGSIHIKFDTGMSRLGFNVKDVDFVIDLLYQNPHVEVQGIMTHLACADSDDSKFIDIQIKRFDQVLERFKKNHIYPKWIHLANSASIQKELATYCTMVRPGLMLYGINPLNNSSHDSFITPVIEWSTKIIQIKEIQKGDTISYGQHFKAHKKMIIATLPVGYADGYPRLPYNIGEVLVSGRRSKILGAICMDLMMIDITDIKDISIDDKVILIGTQDEEHLSVKEIAKWANTIPYEILCGFGNRNERIYT